MVLRKDRVEIASSGPFVGPRWDHSSHQEFVAYYGERSQSPEHFERFRCLRNTILRVLNKRNGTGRIYDVVDIGCNAGTQCFVWVEQGHRVHGLDINEPLLNLARELAAAAGYDIDFRLGSAVSLPWPDESIDICLAVELLEHVADWRSCLKEFTRVLRPGGVLLLTTTNTLCPLQDEFNLPLFGWYPSPIKRYFERLALTTRPDLANYAKYPAVNWFNFYGLRAHLSRSGFSSMDEFDLMDLSNKGSLARFTVSAIRAVPLLRVLAHICRPDTILLAIRVSQSGKQKSATDWHR